MEYKFDPFAPLGLVPHVVPAKATLLQTALRRDIFYTKAEVDAKFAANTGGGGAVSSVFGRAGAVVAAGGDYAASQVTVTASGSQTQTNVQGAINALNLKAQSYQTFIYNSSGTQTGNRYNNLADLMVAKTRQEGGIVIIIEQDETIPPGSYNLDYVTFVGNGSEYNAGGFTITWGDNTTISSWLGGAKIDSIRMLSTSTTGNIFTTALPLLINETTVSNTHSTTYPFYKYTGSGQAIVALRNSSRWQRLGGGVENLEVTSSAFTCQLIISRGDGAVVQNNTLKSTNAVIYLDIIGSSNIDATGYPSTHSGLNVGFELDLYLTDAAAVKNTPAGGISAISVQAAINELDTEKVAKLGSSDVEITDTTKGIILTSPDSSRFRVTIGDDGNLITTEL